MKIAHVAAYYPSHIGGIEYCVKNIAEQSAKLGDDVLVLTSRVGSTPIATDAYPNLRVKYLWGFEFAHTTFLPGLPFRLLALGKRRLIHIHLSHVYTELMVFAIAKLCRRRYVAHYHMDVETSGRLGFLFTLYKRTLLPFVIRGAAKVIALSEEQRSILIDRYHVLGDNVHIIPNGVDETFLLGHPKIYKKPARRLLFVGRFAKQKDLPRLIRAVSLMRHKVELHLVGDGEVRGKLEQLIAELQLTNVYLHGVESGETLIGTYQNSDLFVMTSSKEGMPLVLVEAAASGLPIVASNVQGLREFIGDVGVLVDPPSPEQFALTLDGLVVNPERLSMLSASAYAWAKQRTWPRITQQVRAVYKAAYS